MSEPLSRHVMARWYNKVEEAGFHSFNVIAATLYEHYDEILGQRISRVDMFANQE